MLMWSGRPQTVLAKGMLSAGALFMLVVQYPYLRLPGDGIYFNDMVRMQGA
jgi:hypothetical protein